MRNRNNRKLDDVTKNSSDKTQLNTDCHLDYDPIYYSQI